MMKFAFRIFLSPISFNDRPQQPTEKNAFYLSFLRKVGRLIPQKRIPEHATD